MKSDFEQQKENQLALTNPLVTESSDSPMLKQYNRIKEKYPDALVLFGVGDFYCTFGKDALVASHILNIDLTKYGKDEHNQIEHASFCYEALDQNLPKLVRAGYRVAICDLLHNPNLNKKTPEENTSNSIGNENGEA